MVGKTIGQYKIIERIGRGAMGEVYRAEDTRLRRLVALKFLADDQVDDRAKKRFLREAQAVSRLEHPNICMVYEINETPDGRMYIVMGYYEGESLRQRLQRGRMTVLDAIETAIDIANGLAYAHSRGVVHRDLKPANIIAEKSGNVRIVDFGLAKLVDYASMTESGTTVGTIAYMSPEQATGKVVDGRSDVFSLGVVMYEMIAGRSPFDADAGAAVLYKILNEDPEPLSSQTDVPPRLAEIVMRALDKDPAKRYQSAGEQRDDLLVLLEELDPSRASRWRRLNKRIRLSRRLKPVFTTIVAGAAVLAVVVFLWSRFGGGETIVKHSAGVAVLPFVADRPVEALARGIERDVSVRVAEMSGKRDDLWVVPQGRIVGTSIQDAAERLGVGRIVTGSCREGQGNLDITLDLVDVTRGDTLRSELLQIDDSDSVWRNPMTPALRRLLDLSDSETDDNAEPFGPSNAAAYRYYLTGGGEEPDRAIESYRRSITEDSTFALAHARLGELLMAGPVGSDSIRTLALDHLRAAVRLAPDVSFFHMMLANRLMALGDHDGALEHLDEAVRLSPNDPLVHRTRAQAFQAAQRVTEAERAYQDEIKACPQFWGGYEDLGYFYYTQGRLGEAVTQFLRVRELVPGYASTYNYLGALYQAMDCWDESLENFEKSFALSKSYFACANLGTCYYFFHRFEDAAAMYELALEYNRDDYMVVGNLADAYYWVPGRRERALELFGKALGMAKEVITATPDDARLHALTAGYQAMLEDADASESVERALGLAPENAEINFRACVIYEIIGQRPRSLALLGKAVELGYSPRAIESEPWLADLRKDPRYPLLLDKSQSTGDECDH